MILELAHIVARDHERRGAGRVEVHVEAQVAMNGRRAWRLVDPTIDLAAEKDGLAPKRWLLPPPSEGPEF
jgi:hypothetical protein